MTRTTKTVLESAGVLAVGLAIVGALMFAFAQEAEAHKAGARAAGSGLEVMIHDDGRVLVRGAEVTDIDGDVVRARTEWGASALSWTVRTDDAEFVQKDGKDSDIGGLSTGDYVSFSGTLDEGGDTFTVDADVVKDWSLGDGSDRDDRAHEESKVRAEARADIKAGWGDWAKKLPVLGWFGHKDNR